MSEQNPVFSGKRHSLFSSLVLLAFCSAASSAWEFHFEPLQKTPVNTQDDLPEAATWFPDEPSDTPVYNHDDPRFANQIMRNVVDEMAQQDNTPAEQMILDGLKDGLDEKAASLSDEASEGTLNAIKTGVQNIISSAPVEELKPKLEHALGKLSSAFETTPGRIYMRVSAVAFPVLLFCILYYRNRE